MLSAIARYGIMLIVFAGAVISLTVWAVSTLFPARWGHEEQEESVGVPLATGRARGDGCREAMRRGGDAWEAEEARRQGFSSASVACQADVCLAQHPDTCGHPPYAGRGGG